MELVQSIVSISGKVGQNRLSLNFKPRRAGYKSVYYGINNARPIQSERAQHIEVRKILKFGVHQANVKQDTVVIKLSYKNLDDTLAAHSYISW